MAPNLTQKRASFWLKSGPNFFQKNWRKTNHKFWNHSRLFSLMITVISSLFSLVLCAKNEYVLITIAGNTIFEVQNYKYFSQKFASDFCFKKFGKNIYKFWNHFRLFSLMITVISSLFSLVLCTKNSYMLITIAGNDMSEMQN